MRIERGDIWESDAEAVVIPCNCAGHPRGMMYDAIGRYPSLLDAYKRMALGYPGSLMAGNIGMYITPAMLPTYILFVATKEYPTDDADMAFVERAVPFLASLVEVRGIRSLAVPAMACNNEADFNRLRCLLEQLRTDVRLYGQ
jgi:O-acetyl-ADP-ribose deacetylase (regulator of RNase III)